jgi:hypothetical protein
VPLDGGPAREVEGLSPNHVPRSFDTEDGSLLLSQYPCELSTLNPSTGKVRLFRKLGPADRTAVLLCEVTPSSDGRAYAYTYNRSQADVILAEGLR